MPAAQPSRSSVSNVLGALLAAGLRPGAIRVDADGAFTVEVAGSSTEGSAGHGVKTINETGDACEGEAPSWEDGL